MPAQLEIHPASEDERLAAYRNVHDVWSGGSPMEEHLQRRLSSVQHNQAEWYVGCLEGRVVSSLACFPMQFHLQGRTVMGFSIGSVHTLAEYRGRGFAPQLMQQVEAWQREAGAAVSMLYSDIDPNYYSRMGYRLCPSYEGWMNSVEAGGTLNDREGKLARCSLPEDRRIVQEIYDQFHLQFAISISRDEAYWDFLFRKFNEDEFYFLLNSTGDRMGYVRLGGTPEELIIRDWALREHSEPLIETLFHAVIREAASQQATRLGGWLPDAKPLRDLFAIQEREMEITMLKSLRDDGPLSDEAITSAEYFQEIDHV